MSDQIIYGDNNEVFLPRLRVSQLNENSTRYDRIMAAPPDEKLVQYWSIWAALLFTVGLFSLLLFISIVTNRKVRLKPFNLHLVYLMVPDFVLSLFCSVTFFMNAINGSYWSAAMCNFQLFYVVYGVGANAWINAIIARQIHLMLKSSHARKKYQLPTRQRVTMQCFSAYIWCLFLGTFSVYNLPQFPFRYGQSSGLACMPLEEDLASTLFFWIAFFPMFAGIPTFYAIWVSFDIHRRKLFPPSGKSRILSLYFGRLLLVFCGMWIPTFILYFVLVSYLPPWIFFAGGTWGHLQTAASAIVVIMKPDIRQAFKDFMLCQREDDFIGRPSNIDLDISDRRGLDIIDRQELGGDNGEGDDDILDASNQTASGSPSEEKQESREEKPKTQDDRAIESDIGKSTSHTSPHP